MGSKVEGRSRWRGRVKKDITTENRVHPQARVMVDSAIQDAYCDLSVEPLPISAVLAGETLWAPGTISSVVAPYSWDRIMPGTGIITSLRSRLCESI